MRRRELDWLLFLPILLLSILGLTILRSIAPDEVIQQAVIMGIGLVLALVVALTNYQTWASFSWHLYGLSLLLLLATFVIGQTTRGAIRWLPIGPLQLQTSEIVKPLLVLFLAKFIAERDLREMKTIIASVIIWVVPAILIFRQPDLGSTLVVSALWFGVIFSAGLPLKFMGLGFATLSLLFPVGWRFLKDYQKARLLTFVNPLSDPLASGYNLMQSLIAVGSGTLWGRGLGQGTQSQLRFLPERHTDFVFASFAEELGFVGALLLLLLFALLLWRIVETARHAPDYFGTLVCMGIFSLLMFQIFINVGMNVGLVPITGITLPLISAGGSSLLSTWLSLGLVASVSLRRKRAVGFEIE